MKKIIDIETWERRDNFEFFRGYASSWYAVTTEIECTRSFRQCKETGESFFMRYLHAVLCAANEVEALRYRMTPDGKVALYDKIDIITPIAVPGHTFVTVRIPYIADFGKFCDEARRSIGGMTPETNPYGTEEAMFSAGDYGVIHLSAVPRMYFTSITYTTYETGNACTHPLSTMGKVTERPGNRLIMPYSIYVNHAFVDGSHLSDFFDRIQQRLA